MIDGQDPWQALVPANRQHSPSAGAQEAAQPSQAAATAQPMDDRPGLSSVSNGADSDAQPGPGSTAGAAGSASAAGNGSASATEAQPRLDSAAGAANGSRPASSSQPTLAHPGPGSTAGAAEGSAAENGSSSQAQQNPSRAAAADSSARAAFRGHGVSLLWPVLDKFASSLLQPLMLVLQGAHAHTATCALRSARRSQPLQGAHCQRRDLHAARC